MVAIAPFTKKLYKTFREIPPFPLYSIASQLAARKLAFNPRHPTVPVRSAY